MMWTGLCALETDMLKPQPPSVVVFGKKTLGDSRFRCGRGGGAQGGISVLTRRRAQNVVCAVGSTAGRWRSAIQGEGPRQEPSPAAHLPHPPSPTSSLWIVQNNTSAVKTTQSEACGYRSPGRLPQATRRNERPSVLFTFPRRD